MADSAHGVSISGSTRGRLWFDSATGTWSRKGARRSNRAVQTTAPSPTHAPQQRSCGISGAFRPEDADGSPVTGFAEVEEAERMILAIYKKGFCYYYFFFFFRNDFF